MTTRCSILALSGLVAASACGLAVGADWSRGTGAAVAVMSPAGSGDVPSGDSATPVYSVVQRVPGTGRSWDYAVVDEQAQRLYLAQQGVTSLDLKTGELTTGLVSAKSTHGLALLGDGKVAVDDSATRTVTIFDGATGKVLSTIETAAQNPANGVHALDALVREPKSGLLVAINGNAGLLILIDVDQGKVVGTIPIHGTPEFAVADGRGALYINVTEGKKAEVLGVDITARKVVSHYALKGCEEPTGMAYDQADDLLVSVCDNGAVKFLHRANGQEAASLMAGEGPDAVMFDSQRRLVFVPSGDKGTLSVIAVNSATDIKLVQTLATQKGTRLGAVSSTTGKVYLPTAKFGPPVPPVPYPSVVPGTFEVLVAAPK